MTKRSGKKSRSTKKKASVGLLKATGPRRFRYVERLVIGKRDYDAGVDLDRFSEVLDTPADGITARGFNALLRLLTASPWMYAGVYKQADAVSTVRWRIVKVLSSGKEEVQKQATPFKRLLERPNRLMGWSDLVRLLVPNLKMTGWAFWERDIKARRTIALWPIPSDRIDPEPDPVRYVKWWNVRRSGGRIVELQPHEVIMFKHWSPVSDFYGITGAMAAQNSATLDLWSRIWNKSFFRNGAVPDGYFTAAGPINKQSHERLRNTLRQRIGTPETWNSPLILDGGMTFSPTTRSQRDMQFAELARQSRDEMLGSIGTPPATVGVTEQTGLGTVREQRHQLYNGAVHPLLLKIEETINRELAPEFGTDAHGMPIYLFRFDLNDILSLIEDIEARTRTAESLVTRGLQTINEVRAEMGLGKVPWGDEWWAPLGLAPVTAPARPARPEGLDGVPQYVQVARELDVDEVGYAFDDEGDDAAALKKEAAKALWKQEVNRETKTMTRAVSAALASVVDRIVENIKDKGPGLWPYGETRKQEEEGELAVGEAIFDDLTVGVEASAEDLASELRTAARSVANRQGRKAARAIGLEAFGVAIDKPTFNEIFEIWTREANQRRVKDLNDVVRQVARDAAKDQVDLDELVRRVRSALRDKVDTISPVEGQSDAALFGNFGREDAFKEGGIRFKQWLCVRIPTSRRGPTPQRPRALENHADRFNPQNPAAGGAHEQIVPIDQDFVLVNRRGVLERARFPKDPRLSDENFCNCICFVIDATTEEARAQGVI